MPSSRSRGWISKNGRKSITDERLLLRPTFCIWMLSTLTFLLWVSAVGASEEQLEYPTNQQGMSLVEFQSILYTNVDNEIGALQQEMGSVVSDTDDNSIDSDSFEGTRKEKVNGRFSHDSDVPHEAEELWESLVHHGWDIAEGASSETGLSPFLICVRDISLKSGLQRREHLQEKFNSSPEDLTPLSNQKEQSCFILATSTSRFLSTVGGNIHGIPLVDQMKISPMTIEDVTSPGWPIPVATEHSSRRLSGYDEWERSLMVGLSPGVVAGKDKQMTLNIADKILDDVRNMAKEGQRRRRRLEKQEEGFKPSLRASSKNGQLETPQGKTLSISEAFSATSSTVASRENSEKETRRLSESSHSFWSRALQHGLESKHQCSKMINSLEIRPLWSDGFEIILNPAGENENKMDRVSGSDDESSASNQDCILSLVAALCVHPFVVSVEANTEVTPDGKKEQWITQSNIENYRPFFDKGITGKGQIVSISDSGMDTDNCYLSNGPSGGNIFNGNWDMSTRKIAKYDNTFKDRHDAYKGHGTHVAGIAAGRKSTYGSSDETGDADGIARDAKIHFLDLKMGSGGMSDPGASRWFESIYNGGRGAKVMNGSWGRSGRPYSSHCANYDGALFENDDVVMVTSAGNKGDGGPRTIKNPGDCKNTFAVGLTRSSGTTGGDSQVLNWSAKGPTADGRAKPDILAPGYAVLSANSNPYRTNECDSSGGTRSSSGTSMAAPVVAGLAALTRQYFINGYYPNGYQSYGQGFEPQASLVKAVLMNGAQAVKAGQGIDSTRPHDSIQNMGQVNLITSLPLDGANKINAIVVNGKDIADQASDEMVIRVDMTECDEASISVTMAYTDPAAFPGCGSCLVNDLDLTLTDEHGVKYYPNGLSKEDTKNSAERIRLNSVSHNQKFLVKVKASNLSRQSQKYSLVATGCIKEESFVPPTEEPTQLPTYLPTNDPTGEPTSSPTNLPTDYPTGGPTQSPASTEQTAESRLSTSSVSTTKEPAQTATTMAPRRNPIYNGWPDLIP